MHAKRWISGLIMAPALILFTLYAPFWLFLLFILAVSCIGLKEFYALALSGIPSREKWAVILLSLLPPLALYASDLRCFFAGMTLLALFLFIRALQLPDPFPARVDRVS